MKVMEGPRYSPKVYYNLFYQDISSLGWEISHWSKVQNPQSSAATLWAVICSPYQVLYSGRTVFHEQWCNKRVKTRNNKWQKWLEDYTIAKILINVCCLKGTTFSRVQRRKCYFQCTFPSFYFACSHKSCAHLSYLMLLKANRYKQTQVSSIVKYFVETYYNRRTRVVVLFIWKSVT